LYFLFFFSFLKDDDHHYCLTGGADRTVRLWNPLRLDDKLGGEAFTIHVYCDGHVHPISALACAETTLLSASNKTLVVTDMVTDKIRIRIPNGHDGRIQNVDIRNDAIYASASYDGTVKLWDARNLVRQTPLQICKEAKDSVSSFQFDQSHTFYTASIDGSVRLYDLRKGSITCCNVGSPIVSMALTYDSILVSCMDGCMRLLDKSLCEQLNTYYGSHTTEKYSVGCAITSSLAITGSERRYAAVLYDILSSEVIQTLQSHDGNKATCCVAAYDSCIVTATHGGENSVWTNNPLLVSLE
jgi:mitogen-activated protein kinase organizer 1